MGEPVQDVKLCQSLERQLIELETQAPKSQSFYERKVEEPLRSVLGNRKWRNAVVYSLIGGLFTAWFISIVVRKETRKEWLLPFLLWFMVCGRLVTLYVPLRPVMALISKVWEKSVDATINHIPERLQIPIAAAATSAIFLVGTFCTPSYPGSALSDRAVSFFGVLFSLFVLYLTSIKRDAIQWRTVITGMLSQFLIALFVLRTGCGFDVFEFISQLARKFLGYARNGVQFLTTKEISQLPFFFFSVLPPLIFFVSVVHILLYWGWVQWAVIKFSHVFFWSMRVSGAEAAVAAATPFLGQGESAVVAKSYVPDMTKAELHQVMTSGFATISGPVLIAYIGMGINAQALISSCVMSIPCSLATSKLRFPELEEAVTAAGAVNDASHRNKEREEAYSALHAFSNGAWLGLKIAGCILCNILCIIALVALINGLLGWFASFWQLPDLNLEQICGYLFYPVAFLIGTPRHEIYAVSKLIGVKLIQNEFVAYSMLQSEEYASLSLRSRMLATYSLCSFSNLGAMVSQIAVLAQLAPNRVRDISSVAVSSLIVGAVSTLMSAAVAGMVLADMSLFVRK